MSDLRDRLGDHAFRYYDLWHTIKNNWQDSLMLFIAFILVMVSFIIFFNGEQPKGKMYDCSLAEISPDYPVEVKEMCRKARISNESK